ncbi:ATP-dependent protease La [Metamycoplasma cloacale]|uniref:Lon protease n=1 Tax=Metamycoplasma cloacale TaxID=92401 RepID=A0A2Z4LMC0_9BACT|nr:endopeptidase La [Metamycoplasma cloacale]AWX42886.1 endopeptidase La [Metamycoplasma cloacale]VEU79290.1 ATP-dependent protease La [Metamycoplasma cloacale]
MKQLPFLPIRNQLILPNEIDVVKVGKPKSIETVVSAKTSYNNQIAIGFILDDNSNKANYELTDLSSFAMVANIISITDNNGIQMVKVQGVKFVKISSLTSDNLDNEESKNNIVIFEEIDAINEDEELFNKIFKRIKNASDELKGLYKSLSKGEEPSYLRSILRADIEIEEYINSQKKKSSIHDFIWHLLALMSEKLINEKEKWDELFLSSFSSVRLNWIYSKYSEILQYIKLEKEINSSMRGDMENQQRDFMLREKLNQIKKMLNEDGTESSENKFEKNPHLKEIYPEYVLEAIKSEQSRLASMMPSSPEANISKTYLDLLWKLPWRKVSNEIIDIENVKRILDEHHYGLEKPKERILEFISVLTHKQNQLKATNEASNYIEIKNEPSNFIDKSLFISKSGQLNNDSINNIPILTLIGPPGTGKTTLAKSIAEALGRKFIKISLGGVKDESEIRGHRRTYVGAMPGKIINAIKKAGVSNPVILLDEIDKMSSDFRGDPTSAMLEVLDPEQNVNFQDHYLDLEYDLSKVLFIATANYYDSIPAALIDRVELLELSTYTTIEKIQIAKKYLIPKICKQNCIDKEQLNISDENLEFLIRNYTRESGVRELQRLIDNIARKIVVKILDKQIDGKFVITQDIIKEFLGPIKFEDDENENKSQIGVVNGLAYTSFGGSTLAIEVTTFPGKEGLKLTGQLKDVMKESAQIALAYVRANAEKFGIDFNFDENSIHIHVPAGAIPKDGPSAGVTFTTSIISALSKKPVPANIGMTGEITLRGKVLPIGGLKEKSLAATQFGIRKIFIPFDNEKNLRDVPKEVKEVVQFIPVKYYDEIYNEIFK